MLLDGLVTSGILTTGFLTIGILIIGIQTTGTGILTTGKDHLVTLDMEINPRIITDFRMEIEIPPQTGKSK